MQRHILIVGNGAREYSLGMALKSDNVCLYFFPGNGGTRLLGENVDFNNNQQLIVWIKSHRISLVVIGPEAPLSDGLSDVLRKEGVCVFGPSKMSARLESSKAYMKDFASKYCIPTARYLQSSNQNELIAFASKLTAPIVIKADGLCAGKGVIIAQNHCEAQEAIISMLNGEFGESGKTIVVEEFLDGYELSVFALCDGKDFVILPVVQDHKRLLDKDLGPNTGGMGAYTPTPLCDENLMEKIKERIIRPALKGCDQEGHPFCGVLFAGIMVCEGEPYLLEFNVRFGDPECEVLLPTLQVSLLEILDCCVEGKIGQEEAILSNAFGGKFALGVVLASKNYPYSSTPPAKIRIKDFDCSLGHISFGGVSEKNGELYASGGRICVCVGVGESLKEARENAYKICECVEFEGKQYRKDIGYRAL